MGVGCTRAPTQTPTPLLDLAMQSIYRFTVYPADTNSKHVRSSCDNFMLLQELIALQPNVNMTAVSWFKSFFTPKQFFSYDFFWASCLP